MNWWSDHTGGAGAQPHVGDSGSEGEAIGP